MLTAISSAASAAKVIPREPSAQAAYRPALRGRSRSGRRAGAQLSGASFFRDRTRHTAAVARDAAHAVEAAHRARLDWLGQQALEPREVAMIGGA